jgi:hypothetical protein
MASTRIKLRSEAFGHAKDTVLRVDLTDPRVAQLLNAGVADLLTTDPGGTQPSLPTATSSGSDTQDLGDVFGNVVLDLSTGQVFVARVIGATTFSFVNWPAGAVEPTVIATQDATGGRTLGFAGVNWLPPGSTPAFQVGPGQVNITSFFSIDRGVTVYGQAPATPFLPQTTDYSIPGSYTYNVPAGATTLDVIAVGGGGGGAGGSRDAATAAHSGGAGGGGAGYALRSISVPDLGYRTALTVVVAAGGAGGAGVTADTSSGAVGANGGQSTLDSADLALRLVKAGGGSGGGNGRGTAAVGGNAGVGTAAGNTGGNALLTGTASQAPNTSQGGGGGGAGGSLSAAGAALSSGNGSASNSDNRVIATTLVADPAVANAIIKGADGAPGFSPTQAGLGGRGGAATTTVQAGQGGVGGWPGGGGGGGGASLNGFTSGTGGKGGDGAVRIVAR